MTLAEAHKTGRKYRRAGWHSWRENKSGMTLCVDNAIADDWETEPEVYEVECTWERSNGFTYPCSCSDQRFSAGFGKSLLKKRTKLTIEVLD